MVLLNQFFEKMPSGCEKSVDIARSYISGNKGLNTTFQFFEAYRNSHYTHSICVSAYSYGIANVLGVSTKEVQDLVLAGLVHDIGKLCIPTPVLNKPDKLTDGEFNAIKGHTIYTAKILTNYDVPDNIIDIARHHHEKLNGRGYPDRLTTGEISNAIQIIVVADIYSALRQERSYKAKMSHQDAITIMRNNIDGINQKYVDILDELNRKKILC